MTSKAQALARVRNFMKFRLLGIYVFHRQIFTHSELFTQKKLVLINEFRTIQQELIREQSSNTKLLTAKIKQTK